MDITGLLADHGLIFVFLGCLLEGDTVAVTAGVLAHHDTLPYGPTVIAAALGGWASDLGIFAFGRLFRRNPRVTRTLAYPRAQRIIRRFLGRPVLLAAIFRFIPATRTIAPLALATATPISFALYAVVTGPACLLWALIVVTVGADLGALVTTIWAGSSVTARFGIAVIAAVGTVVLWRWWSLRRTAGRRTVGRN